MVCHLSSQLLAEGRKGMKGRMELKPREKFLWFLDEDVQWYLSRERKDLAATARVILDCLRRRPGWTRPQGLPLSMPKPAWSKMAGKCLALVSFNLLDNKWPVESIQH